MLKPMDCTGLTFSESCLIEEYYYLFGVAALLRPKRILEIGTNMGLGTLSLWKGASSFGTSRNVHIVTIEKNPACIPYIEQNWKVQKCPPKYLHIMNDYSSTALEALRHKRHWFGLCFIDGDHSYEGTHSDWVGTQALTDFWVMHDSTQMSGVRRMVEEIRESGDYDVFSFDEYPFGTQWSQRAEKYVLKKSIPGMTLVRRKNPKSLLPEEELSWLELVRNR